MATIAGLKQKLPQLRDRITRSLDNYRGIGCLFIFGTAPVHQFSAFYRHVFQLTCAEGEKNLPKESALAMWPLALSLWPTASKTHLANIISFLEGSSDFKRIKKDEVGQRVPVTGIVLT